MRTSVLKEILRSENAFGLRVLQQYLEEHDIQAVIMDEHSGALMNGIGNILPRLMVLDEDYDVALELVKRHEENS